MDEFLTVVLILIIAIPIILMTIGYHIVPQSHAYVIERLGSYHETWNEGLHFFIPFVFRIAQKVLLKEQVINFRPQPVLTRDNVTMQVNTLVYY